MHNENQINKTYLGFFSLGFSLIKSNFGVFHSAQIKYKG